MGRNSYDDVHCLWLCLISLDGESESLHNTDFLFVIFYQLHKPSSSEVGSPQTAFFTHTLCRLVK